MLITLTHLDDKLHCMLVTLTHLNINTFDISQLADDTALYAGNINSLKHKFEKVLKFSKEKCQVPNMKKTKYIHFPDKPSTTPLVINQQDHIHPIEVGKSHRYLESTLYLVVQWRKFSLKI